jgi:hypothetical protein
MSSCLIRLTIVFLLGFKKVHELVISANPASSARPRSRHRRVVAQRIAVMATRQAVTEEKPQTKRVTRPLISDEMQTGSEIGALRTGSTPRLLSKASSRTDRSASFASNWTNHCSSRMVEYHIGVGALRRSVTPCSATHGLSVAGSISLANSPPSLPVRTRLDRMAIPGVSLLWQLRAASRRSSRRWITRTAASRSFVTK